jgi:hypothetical protein
VGRQCLSCPNPAVAKEHLWAESILKTLAPSVHPMRAVIGKSAPVEFRGDVQIRCVCHGCNNGWMSTLEGTVKTTVGAMIHDISVALSRDDQMAISRWAMKTAMVLEATIHKDGQRLYTRNECEQLRLHSAIPGRSLMWLGRISDTGLFASGTHVWLDNNLGGATCDGQVATFTIDHLVIQVLTIHIREDDGKPARTVCRSGPWDDSLIGIYPFNQVVIWPPRLTFSTNRPLLFTELRDRWKIGTKR